MQPQPFTPDYTALYESMVITKPQAVVATARIAMANKARYEAVVNGTKIPWQFVACIHNRESSQNWKRHLHNGDPLTARTIHVPAGRPVTGIAPFTWEESTKDALFECRKLPKDQEWSIEDVLWHFEGYNGMGYQRRGLLSPYLWSFSNHYIKGKYVADGRFDPNAVDLQIGCAPLYKVLMEM